MSKEILFGTNNSQLTSTSSLTNASTSLVSSALIPAPNNKLTLDQIASILLKQNFVLTALEFHTELAETGRELPRLRDYFSNPSHFEQPIQQQLQQQSQFYSGASSLANSSNNAGFYPLHKASSIQTFDSLDLTRYSDDVDQNKFNDDKICVLEFELRKAKETITQLRNTLTLATGCLLNLTYFLSNKIPLKTRIRFQDLTKYFIVECLFKRRFDIYRQVFT